MRYYWGPFILLAGLVLSAGLGAQSLRLGISGALSATIDEVNGGETFQHRNIGVIGTDLRYQFSAVPLETGLKLRYGSRNLLDKQPEFNTGLFTNYGLKRDLELFFVELPLLIHVPLSRSTRLSGGVQGGLIHLKANEQVTVYVAGPNGGIGRTGSSTSGTTISASPLLELTHKMALPVFLSIGAGYRFLAVDVDWLTDVESAQVLNNFLSTDSGQFDFGGFYFTLGFAVQLWEPED